MLNTTLEKKVDERTKELVVLSKKLAKYFSPQVCQSIFWELDVKIQTQRKPLAVFLRSWRIYWTNRKTWTRSLNRNSYTIFNWNVKNCYKMGGTIDKFIGDALLVFFGDPNQMEIKRMLLLVSLWLSKCLSD